MKHAFIFPGQGSQFPGMGKEQYHNSAFAKKLFEQANEVLGFRISDIMFDGTEEDLKQTNVTQPAVFLHSIMAFKSIDGAKPDMVAGHSLGEFSALVANGTLSFHNALRLVSIRAKAMQKACELKPSTMAAILGLADEKVESICADVQNETGEVVVAANYNCPGQLVISGSIKGIEIACEKLKAAGAKRALVLPVGGMGPATDSPSAITNLNLPLKVELMLSIVMGPSLILNSTPAPKPGLPWYFFRLLNTGRPSAIAIL